MKKQKMKADEMEMSINFRAMRIAYTFIQLCLAFYCVYKLAVCGELPEVAVIWFAGVALFFIAKLIYTRKMTRTNDNEE